MKTLIFKPRHKWFYAWRRDADRWNGPYDSMEDAIQALASEDEVPWVLAFLTQGRKLKKSERDEMGVDYEWEVSGNPVFKIAQASL